MDADICNERKTIIIRNGNIRETSTDPVGPIDPSTAHMTHSEGRSIIEGWIGETDTLLKIAKSLSTTTFYYDVLD